MDAQQLAEILVQSCNRGDVQSLQSLLAQNPGIDVNYATEGGVTLLMHTIIGAGTEASPDGYYLETCQLLMQSGAILETADVTYGRTVAHWAAYYHREDILAELIIAGADMTSPDYSGNSPFHVAIEEGATECIIETLRFLPKEILEYPDAQNRTAVMHAVQMGNAEICQILVQSGASLETVHPETGQSPLHIAAAVNSGLILELLLQSGATLDAPDSSGLTPVHIASIVEGSDAINAITNVVGNEILNVTDVNGMTPLMHACESGNEGNVRLLLRKKVDVGMKDVEGRTCLHWAAMSKYPSAPKCAQVILKKHRELLEAQDAVGRNALHSCASSGRVETLDVLLSYGSDVTAVDTEQHTAVHWVAVSGNPSVLPRLIESGCPVAAPDVYGAHPLHYAAQHAREPHPDDTNFEEASIQSQNVLGCLRILLEKGAPVACKDKQGLQPLHWALQFPNNQAACTLLFSNGADPSARDSNGLTCLHMAAQYGLSENCHIILEQAGGTIVNELDNQGQTALFHALESGSLECTEYLLGVGFLPNHLSSEQRSPSHIAATLGLLQCLQLLHAYGADINLKSIHGATPLHEAAANGHADVLEYLLINEVPPNEQAGPSRATALHYAVSGGHEDCVKLLLQYGGDVNSIAMAEEGYLTPIDYALEQQEALVDFLREQGALSGRQIVPDDDVAKAQHIEKRSEEQAVQPGESLEPAPVAEESEVTQPEISLYLKGRRASSPSKQSVEGVIFEEEKPLYVHSEGSLVTAARRPSRQSMEGVVIEEQPVHVQSESSLVTGRRRPRPLRGLFEKAMSVLQKGKAPPPESILSSAVGYYAAHATLLAAAIIGTPLGEKVSEIAEKVTTDTAEDLKRAAAAYEGELPDIMWLKEEEPEPPPMPTIEEKPPSPSPSPPPSPPVFEIKEDPYERRLHKARAQMDMSKSVGFRATEELLKAQETHMKLKRKFEESKFAENIANMKEAFQIEEQMAKQSSDALMRKFDERMKKAKVVSEQVNETIEHKLQEAKHENERIAQIMGSMGISPRPTVSQWLEQKRDQKKTAVQEALIVWDRSKERREAAILLEQAITSQRAMKHAAWGAKKEISAKLRTLKMDTTSQRARFTKGVREVRKKQNFPKPPSYDVSRAATKPLTKLQTPNDLKAVKDSSKSQRAAAPSSSVRATPQGFRKIRENETTSSVKSPQTVPYGGSEVMWKMGKSLAEGKFSAHKYRPPSQEYLRATGPKDVHAPRTLYFLPPKHYHSRKLKLQHGVDTEEKQSTTQSLKTLQASSLHVHSLEFPDGIAAHKKKSGPAVQYHSHADSLAGQPSKEAVREQSAAFPILPMKIVDGPNLPTAVVT